MTELIAQFIRYLMLMREFRDQKVYTRGTTPFLHKQFLDFREKWRCSFLRYKGINSYNAFSISTQISEAC